MPVSLSLSVQQAGVLLMGAAIELLGVTETSCACCTPQCARLSSFLGRASSDLTFIYYIHYKIYVHLLLAHTVSNAGEMAVNKVPALIEFTF